MNHSDMTGFAAIALLLASILIGLFAVGLAVGWLTWLLAYCMGEDNRARRMLLLFSAAIPVLLAVAWTCFYLGAVLSRSLITHD